MTKDRIVISDYIGESLDVENVINDSLLKCEDEVEKDAICLQIKQDNKYSTLCTYRNFSATVGAQKSRKTFFNCMMMGAAVLNGDYCGIIAHTVGRKNIYFDTEQADYHAQMSNKRISMMSDNNGKTPLNFQYYRLRRYSYIERLAVIGEILKRTKNIGFVVIDGIRDLVSSINDEQQSTEVIESLMQWTDDYNCHINLVIHVNKGEMASPRGWLGTEIQNKSETVIEIKKHDEMPNILSKVIPRDCRGMGFDEFTFEIENGLPKVISETGVDVKKMKMVTEGAEDDLPY